MKPAATSLERRTRATWERCADATCVEFEDRAWTWQQVRQFAEKLDALLEAHGCSTGARVGVVARSHPAVLATQIALLATGRELAIVNPYQDPRALAEDVAGLRADAVVALERDWMALGQQGGGAGTLRTRVSLPDDLLDVPHAVDACAHPVGTVPAAVDACERPAGAVAAAPGAAAPPAREATALAPAVIEMLTSGTTGAPKRVRMRADTVEAAGQDSWDTLAGLEQALGVQDREQPFLMFWPLTNVGGLSFVFHQVLEGRAMVLFERFDVGTYMQAVRRFRPAVLTLPPAHLRMVMNARVPREDLACAAVVRSANAPLDPGLRDEFEATYGVPIMTYYGATEFCGVVSGWQMDMFRRCRQAKAGSVGLPRPGVAFRIVGPDGDVLPAQETGTVEVQVERIGPGWMRTSDVGRLDADGFLFLGGRSDGAINRGGFKVLPETIAAALRSHPAVDDAVVVGRPDARLGAVPVAFVELRAGAPVPSAEALREHARERLIAYQVPEQVCVLERLPRTPTLKVNLAELQQLAAASQDAPSRQGDKQ